MSYRMELKSSRLGQISRGVRRRTERALDNVAEEGQAFARSIAPVRTGFHRSQITATREGTTITLEAGASYSLFLELGTRYMAPRPTVAPSVEYMRPRFWAAIIDAVQKGMEGR